MDTFKLDDRVKVIGKNAKGKIAFIGKIHLSEGTMYGIALDKPKGRCSGQIGNVSYFNCPVNHGVFVRACQLEMDDGNLSDLSDEFNGDVIPRPVYPNYLKFSSKMNLRKSKYHSKSKDFVAKVKSPLKQDAENKQRPGNNQYMENASPGMFNKYTGLQVKKKRHLSRKRGVKRTSDEEKFLTEKVNMQNQQIDTIRRYLKKLKTYVRWSRGFDLKENQMKNLLDTAIDSVIRNMVEIVGNSEKGNDLDHKHDHGRGDIGLDKENDILLQCVWDLEKKNETLVECIAKIRSLLLNSGKLNSRGKFKSEVHKTVTSERPYPSENDHRICPPKNPETQPMSNLSAKNEQHLDEILQKDCQGERETETLNRFLESLNLGAENKNEEASTFNLHSKNENGLDLSSETDAQPLSKVVCVRNYLESINSDIEELKKELSGMSGEKSNDKCEEKVSSKPNLLYENGNSAVSKENQRSSPTNEKVLLSPKAKSNKKHKTKRQKTNIRHRPYLCDKKLNREQNASNETTDVIKDENDSTKQLSECISNIMTNITLNKQNEMEPKDPTNELSELISNITTNINSNGQNVIAPKETTKFKGQNIDRSVTTVVVGKSYSYPDSDKCEKASTASNKIKSEDNLKSRKFVRGGNISRRKSPKKRIHFK